MNPIFQWIIAHTTAKALARLCPKCQRTQIVQRSQIRHAVPCRFCGTTIPPRGPSDKGPSA